MMKKFISILALCSTMSMGLFAQKSDDNVIVNIDIDHVQKYTFSDFFDALDLPTVLGVGFTPNGIEGATFNSAMRLGWRHHKNYGTFVYITYDTHSNSYDSLMIEGSNVCKGEVWYNEIGMSVGYRFPLVKDIKAFYETPYFHPWDMYISVQPGVSIATIKNFEVFDGTGNELTYYEMQSQNHVVPTMRFTVGVECFVFPNFSVFAEAAYTQHVTPTIIEQTAIHQKQIQNPSGPITFSLGLSLFFK